MTLTDNNIDLVIFDLGGTTIRDTGQVPLALTTAMQANGFMVTPKEISSVRGATKREVIRRFVAPRFAAGDPQLESLTEHIFLVFRECLEDNYATGGVHTMPGAQETFSWLRSRGIKIAINTGFDRIITAMLLQAAGWDKDFIQAVVCGDDVSLGRPAPFLIFHAMEATGVVNVRRVASVGDTVLDLQAGHNAGVLWNIGVLSGSHSKEQLGQVEHTILLPSVAALPKVWDQV